MASKLSEEDRHDLVKQRGHIKALLTSAEKMLDKTEHEKIVSQVQYLAFVKSI